MDFTQIVLLALIQGITEFLPISSSAHLILVPVLTGWQDQGLAFDVAVHVGTLLAVVLYFRRELVRMAREWLVSLTGRRLTSDAKLAWAVIFATIPAGLAGLLLEDFVAHALRSPVVIALATIGFGLLLWWADATGRRVRSEHHIGWRDVVVIGIAQALALIPGTSRSGITMTAALAMGLTREAAARFSFLLSIPIILAAGGLETLKLVDDPNPVAWDVLVSGAVLSGVSAFFCIHFFLKLLERVGMLPFVIYRLVLGIFLLAVFAF
jgi:undecaprenyl-diphosphatase